MKMVMRPQPTQLPSHLRVTATTNAAFNRDTYLAHGYRKYTVHVVGGGGKGGNGGARAESWDVNNKYNSGGGGSGGNSGGIQSHSNYLKDLPPGNQSATVGGAAAPSSFFGQNAIAGVAGGNGGPAGDRNGGVGGVAPNPAAGSGSVKGSTGVAGGAWTFQGNFAAPANYSQGGAGGVGYTDPITGHVNGSGGKGGSGAGPTTTSGGTGAAGAAGVVVFDFSIER